MSIPTSPDGPTQEALSCKSPCSCAKSGLYHSSREAVECARSKADRNRGAASDAELRDEPVAVAAVDRARELDDLALRRVRHPLEQEGRRVERDVERLGLL